MVAPVSTTNLTNTDVSSVINRELSKKLYDGNIVDGDSFLT